MTCEHDHQIKQQPAWNARQTSPATRVWTTPSRRTYTSHPRHYPA
jgi:hypothetical protein